MTPDPISRWHQIMQNRDVAGLDALLGPDAVNLIHQKMAAMLQAMA